MKNILTILVISFGFGLLGCNSQHDEESTNEEPMYSSKEDEQKLVSYDFNKVEIPVVIQAPAGAQIIEGVGNGKLGNVRTINYELVKNNFKLDVNYVTGASYYKENLMEVAKQSATESEGFDGFIHEEEFGFIYKFKKDKADDYNFYYLLIKDNQPIEFETGLSYSPFTLQQVKELFEAAKTAR